MSLTGWMGLAFIWLVVSGIIAGILTYGSHIRAPMPMVTVKYENAKPDTGFINMFALFWFGLFVAGCGIVGGARLVRGTATAFHWIDGWFV